MTITHCKNDYKATPSIKTSSVLVGTQVGCKTPRATLLSLLVSAAALLPALSARAGVALTILYSFTGTNGGEGPRASLVQGLDGNFYGASGTAFKVKPDGTLTTLCSLSGIGSGGYSDTALVQASNGSFYGALSAGSIFELNTNGTVSNLVSVGDNGPGPPGIWVTLGSDGNLYAVTSEGGTGFGSIFRVSPSGALSNLYSFAGRTDGRFPGASLTEGNDGYFYGTTSVGGGPNFAGGGTVFKISATGPFTTLHVLVATNDGYVLQAALVWGNDGNLYGTASEGGASNAGTVFKVSTNGTFVPLYAFTGGSDGETPLAALDLGSDGLFYGTTEWGGAFGLGAIFQVSTNGNLATIYSFSGGNDGANPMAGLVQGNDGRFYGGTSGTIFSLAILPEFQSETLTNGALNLTWSTEAGGTYQLQYTSDVTSSNWTNLGGAMVATGSSLSGTDFVTNNAQRFYRVVLAP